MTPTRRAGGVSPLFHCLEWTRRMLRESLLKYSTCAARSTEQWANAHRSPFWALALLFTIPASADDVIVVVGASGTPEYGQQFETWTGRWKSAAEKRKAKFTAIGLDVEVKEGGPADRERLAELLKTKAGEEQPLWLVLIGHGTYDGKTARFNLRGDDVSATELAEWLKPLQRPLAVINCTSCSGPFLAALSGPNRVIVTATKSGHEYNFARLGEHLSSAITDPAADLNKDEQTSILEAWLRASAAVREFYTAEARLATEHALLDDNGDGLGTPPEWFQGLRVTKTAKPGSSPDGILAGQWHLVRSGREEQLAEPLRKRRDEIERELAKLRQQKTAMPEEEYLGKLEPLLVELARLYAAPQEVPKEKRKGSPGF